jgi:hypothetical protein
MSKATEAQLSLLHGVVAEQLKKRIESGEATAADFGAAIKFLKDNGIEAVKTPGSPLAGLLESLPFAGEDDFPDTPAH